jgi:uncharacterized repeat protein (TIGR01451 family)
MRRHPLLLAGTVVAVLAAAVIRVPAADAAAPWVTGDLVAAVGNGSYRVYDTNGNLKETISDGLGGTTTGCTFNPTLTKLYTTNWSLDKVEVYDDATHNLVQTINTTASNNEMVVFDAAGTFYVSHAVSGGIDHYAANGVLLNTLAVGVRTDWMDLSADQATMFYTTEGSVIHRWNVVTNTPLPDFATVPSGEGFGIRLLPPFDGSGGLLVAQADSILRYSGAGAIVQTYDLPGVDTWFTLALDPDGTSFWATAGNVYRFAIATGTLELGPVPAGALGLCVKGEPTAATRADVSIAKTGSPDPVTVNGVLTYQVTVSNAGPAAATGVTVTDSLPSGVTFVSATPSQGGCSFAAGTVTCALGTVPDGGGATITITVRPDVKAALSNTARVTANQTDPAPANNSATATTRALLVRASAFGEQVRSLLVNSGPLPTVSQTRPGFTSATLAVVNVPGVLNANTLTVAAQASNEATAGSQATVARANLLAGVVTADAIRSTCTATASGATGTTTIDRLAIGGQILTNLNPAPNTGINIPGVGLLLLNEQTVPEPGGLTVNAVHLHVLTGVDVILAQATCVVDP